ncbi:MAG: 16S rRNA (cytosine(967)-C(5))-methyltransferase RsmB [Oscillospiraceae bacterium]|nr:16S rRNA (cytosine(967)-C(5))-methyltransferase RsmB [Oscillospiraceae bacterium]
MGARETALAVLIACRKDGAWSNGVLKEYCAKDGLDKREAALTSRLCYGVLQNRLRLDFYLKQLLTGKLKDLHPAVRDVLHLGLYQIFLMDKIPESAAVNESVDLAKKYCRKVRTAPGLVNAVLRNAVRNRKDIKEPTTLSDRYSHPQKLVDLLTAYVGKDRLEDMLRANNEAAPTVVQVNTCAVSTDALLAELAESGVEAQKHPWLSDCLILSGIGDLTKLPAFENGLFYVQDAAAKLSVLCAQIPRGASVLDCCAAPGGKSFAAAISGAGTVISCDVHPHKVDLLEKGTRRLHLTQITAREQDATVFVPQWEKKMDVVIADVPCSGYGIIRKKPDIRYKDPDSMADLPGLQLAILRNQARYVKPGGVLLYSTCTLVRKENEGVVEKFLKENPEFTTERLTLPPVFPENTTGMLTLIPGQYDTDGFFICRLRRKE